MIGLELQQPHSGFSAGLSSTKYPLASSWTPSSSVGLVQPSDKVVYVESVTFKSITLPGGSERFRTGEALRYLQVSNYASTI